MDLRPPLVDLGRRAAGRVDDECRSARLVGDADEVVEDRLVRQLFDDARPRSSPGEACRDNRNIQPLQRARDVDPFPAGKRETRACAMAMPRLEVWNRERAVDRSVERHGDDHEKNPKKWCNVRRA